MCKEEDVVTLWCLIEAPVGVWAGDGTWPTPKTPDEDNNLICMIQLALMHAIKTTVKGRERYSLTIFLTNVSALPIEWAIGQDANLRRQVEENASQIVWKEWQSDKLEGGG